MGNVNKKPFGDEYSMLKEIDTSLMNGIIKEIWTELDTTKFSRDDLEKMFDQYWVKIHLYNLLYR